MPFTTRPYQPDDLPHLYRICLLTGESGQDASALYRDPQLLGHYYAAPYGVLEPELAFILANDGAPCGYVLGARDSEVFALRCEREWFPALRARYPLPDPADPSPDAQMVRLIHRGYRAHPDLADYPAHLHIDLLPEAQGQGWGRKLMATLLDAMRALAVPAVHLGVGRANSRAIAFYERVGFARLQEHPWGMVFGMRLASEGKPPGRG